MKFYTGFPTYDHFKLFFELVKPTAEAMVYVYASGIGTNRPGVGKMQLIDELFLFCVRLKLGLFELDLAQRFELHVASVSRKITTWANFLYFFLGNQPIWPTRECINELMPASFKELYPSTRVIIDCTEIYAQTPSSLLLQSLLYSSYKSNTTLKGLIGIAPHGAITFVSSLYTGSISEKEITRCSGILDLLEAHDSVMADKGFDIEDLLRSKQVSLNLPPFLQSQTQFSAQDVLQTKTIAKVRIHVERAIRRIKEFHLFDSDISLSILGSVNQLYTVACLLTNFQGALIKDKQNQVNLFPSGLVINPKCPWLGCTPDRKVFDLNAENQGLSPFGLLAIKVVKEGATDFANVAYLTKDRDANVLKLKRNHDYYYQVQCQMALTGLE